MLRSVFKFCLRDRGARLLEQVVKLFAIVAVSLACNFVFAFTYTDQAVAQTKSLKLYYTHTKERTKIVFKKNGRYDKAGLKKLNRFLRDWRSNEPINMDPRLFDAIWEVYRQSGSSNYIHVVSAYRSPATNAMLRKTRGGQAKKSQHMVGKAMDFFIPGVRTSKLRAIAMKLQGGGVGYYPKSATPFVHVDVGSVRAWPRMSRKELVKLFPNGKTLHLPSDGKPLPGYNVALREYKRRGGGIATSKSKTRVKEKPAPKPIIVAKATPKAKTEDKTNSSGGLFGNLFGRRNGDDKTQETIVASREPVPQIKRVETPTFAQNLVSLPTTNIPIPTLLNNGVEDTVITAAPTLVASIIPQPDDAPITSVQPLAYGQADDKAPLPSFTAIIAAALETDKKRKKNGEVPTPVLASIDQFKEQPRFDLASLETPKLREHNRINRAELGANISKAWEASNKAGRPNLRDAIAAKYKANTSAPTLEQITISRRVFSQDTIVNMKPPAKGPRFVNRFMRKAPKVIYANGFSKNNVNQQKQTTFTGNAVNFLPVLKYSG